MTSQVTFKSPSFRPLLPENCQVNPGRYGAELAFWLCGELMKLGVITSYPNYEDWGWFIEYVTEEDDEFWLCCGNVEGANDEWMCFIEPKGKGLFGKKKAPRDRAAPLLEALRSVLESDPSVTDVRWASVSS